LVRLALYYLFNVVIVQQFYLGWELIDRK